LLTGRCGKIARANHHSFVWFSETELSVEPVRVFGRQEPSEVLSGTIVNHRAHQQFAETLTTMIAQYVDITEVGVTHSVRHCPCVTDKVVGPTYVNPHNSPRSADLLFDLGTSSPAVPVGLRRKESVDGIDIESSGTVVSLVGRHGSSVAVAVHAPVN
jgi:hypothetical protein